MKINQNVTFLNKGASAPSVAAAKTSAPVSAPAAPSPAVSTQATLPSTNTDFDAARVARIRDSISAGLYQVNTAKIADGLLSTVRDLIKKTPQ